MARFAERHTEPFKQMIKTGLRQGDLGRPPSNQSAYTTAFAHRCQDGKHRIPLAGIGRRLD
jgi:hypothetical protein